MTGPRKCTVVRTEDPNTFEVRDPNNESCPLVGPFTDRNKANAKRMAREQARRLDDFYKRNWRTWSTL